MLGIMRINELAVFERLDLDHQRREECVECEHDTSRMPRGFHGVWEATELEVKSCSVLVNVVDP